MIPKKIYKTTICFTIVILSISITSCNKDDDRIDFYKSQHRSEELKGWWRKTNEVFNIDHPKHIHLNDVNYFIYGFQSDKQYSKSSYYWYNDENKIYILSAGDIKVESTENNFNFILNNTKDTLRLMHDPIEIYVKDTGL